MSLTELNSEIGKIKQDLLLFKNDILKQMSNFEEIIKLKLGEYNTKYSKQNDLYEKKFVKLTTQITHANSMIINNVGNNEKINNLQLFKSIAEENFNRLNLKINTIQKEHRNSINDIENIIYDNLKYPGIIGPNDKFVNFRQFIDYIVKTIKEFNEFKKEVRNNNDFDDFKKKTNSSIKDVKISIKGLNENFIHLIEDNIKEFNSRIDDIIEQNKKMENDNENKFAHLKNQINYYLSENRTKLFSLEKIINDFNIEQLNIIKNCKISKNKLMKDKNKIEINYKLTKKVNELNEYELNDSNNKNLNNINNMNPIISPRNKKSIYLLRNFNSQTILKEKDRNNYIYKNLTDKNKNNKPIKYSTQQINSFGDTNGKNQIIENPKSFEKNKNIIRLTNHYIINKNQKLRNLNEKKNFRSINQDIIENKEREDISNSKIIQNDFKNNKACNNISNIKLNNLPSFNSTNIKKINNNIPISTSSVSVQKPENKLLNNKYLIPAQKFFFQRNNIDKSNFETMTINIYQDKKLQQVEYNGHINKRDETKFNKDLNSLTVMKAESRDNVINSIDKINKRKNRTWSFEKDEDKIDEGIHNRFAKTLYKKKIN